MERQFAKVCKVRCYSVFDLGVCPIGHLLTWMCMRPPHPTSCGPDNNPNNPAEARGRGQE